MKLHQTRDYETLSNTSVFYVTSVLRKVILDSADLSNTNTSVFYFMSVFRKVILDSADLSDTLVCRDEHSM